MPVKNPTTREKASVQGSTKDISNRRLSLQPSSPRCDSPTAPFLDWTTSSRAIDLLELNRNRSKSSAMIVSPERRACLDQPGLSTLLPATALNNLARVTPEAIIGWSIGEKYLLTHFLQVVSRALVVVDDDANPFLLHVVPLALTYEPVRHATVALVA